MNKLVLVISLSSAIALQSSFAAFSLSGTSLNNPAGLADGQTAVYVISVDGTSFGSLTSVGADLSLTDSATYGDSFEVFNVNSTAVAQEVFSNVALGSGVSTNITGDINTGDQFAVIVYGSSDTVSDTIQGDTFSIWTDASWLIGTDGGFDFPDDYVTLTSVADFTGSVVPEPSTYAALSGLLALGYVMVRRRK